jgi:hypothetical protein
MTNRRDGRLRADVPKTNHIYWIGCVRLVYRERRPRKPAKKGKPCPR